MTAPLLYERLAERLRGHIRRGLLPAGERMPSLRRVGREQHMSLATVVEAYSQLEREGLIEARPRSGFFVRSPVTATPQSPLPRAQRGPQPLRNPALLGVLDVFGRADLVPLHTNTPSPALLPTKALAASTARVLRRQPENVLRYTQSQGLGELRQRIARRYARCGVDADPEEIVITAGAMEAITLSLRATTRPGDTVLVETPTFYGVLQAVAGLGLRVLEVPNRPREGIDVERLRELIARHRVQAAVLVPNFNNPHGSLTSDADKRALVAACHAHGVQVIEDDIYGELAYSGERPAPLRRFDPDGRVITCGSFSKTLAPGLRLGWALAGARAAEVVRTKCFSSVATATLPQLATCEFLGRHDLDRHLRRLRRELATNVQRYSAAIARHWPAGTCVSQPAGGMALWVQVPGIEGQALFDAALAQRIGILPGHLFSSHGDHRQHVRLACGMPWTPVLEDALRTLGRLAHRLAD